MVRRTARVLATGLCLALAGAASARAEPTVSVRTPGGTADDFTKADLSRPGPRGGRIAGPFGTTDVGDVRVGFSGQGDRAAVDVSVGLKFTLNTARVGEKYTVRESGECRGLEFKMTEDFVRDHELEHVAQIKDEIRKRVDAVLKSGRKTVVTDRGEKRDVWRYNASAPDPGQVGAPGEPGWQAQFQKSIRGMVERFLAQEAAEYAHAEKFGTFPAGGEFPGIEKRARAKSCDEFLKQVGAQVRQAKDLLDHARGDLAESRGSLKAAVAQTKTAGEAAAAALAAVSKNPCDLEAFRRAVERYTHAASAADTAADEARNFADAARDHVGEIAALLAAYGEAKVQAHVTAFPQLDRAAHDAESGRKALQAAVEAWTKTLDPDLKKVREDLAAARAKLKEAYEKLKGCAGAQDPKWQPLRDAVKRLIEVAPGPGAPAPPGEQAKSEGPTAENLRNIIQGLPQERPVLPPPVYTPYGPMYPGTVEPAPPPPIPQLPLPPAPPPRLARPEHPCAPSPDADRRREEERRRREDALRARLSGEAALRRAREPGQEPMLQLPTMPSLPGTSTVERDRAVARLASLMRSQPAPQPAGAPAFVPGEVLVGLRVAPAAAQAPIVADLEARLGLIRRDSVTLASIGTELVLFEAGGGQTVPGALAALAADPRVVLAQPNFLSATAAGEHRDALADLQYGPRLLRVPATHARVTGRAVRVAVLDTGVDGHHPDLVGRIALRANVAAGADAGEVHGTAVAGIVAATADNGVGIYGVAPEAAILAVRACRPVAPGAREGLCTSYALARGLEFAMLNGARVVNLSVAGPPDALLAALVARAHARGIVVVAAVGNLGPGAPPTYPAALPDVVAVTAVDASGALYPAAVHGPFVSVAAPGVEVVSTLPRGRFGVLTGTSMAAAHVSGVAALLLQAKPDLSPAALRQALEGTARSLGTGRSAQHGHGLVDGCRAVDGALGGRLGC